MRGTIHEDLVTNLDEGYFGGWKLSGNDLLVGYKTGRLMRPALPGERGNQVVKLSESDAEAYQKAKAAGADALDRLVVEDLTLKSRAERHAMGVMQSLENNIDARKFPDVQQLVERYKQEMAGVRVTSKGAADGRDDVQRLTPTGTLGTKEDLSNFGATKLLGSDWAVKGAAVLPSNAMNLQPHGTLPKIEPARLLIEKGGTIVSKSDEGTQTIARQYLDGSIRFNDVKTLDQVVQSAGEDPVTSFDANGRSIEGKIALTPYHSLSETVGNILFNLGATGKTIQASAAPTQSIGGWILVHNVGVENITSSAGNVDLKAVAAAAGFSYTQHDDPKITDFEKEVKALKAWDIYIYSGHGTSRGNIVAYGPPPAGSKYSTSLFG